MPTRPSPIARARKLSVHGALVALVLSSLAIAGPFSSTSAADVPLIYHKGRNFRIPFNLNAESRERIKEFHLLVSEDQGYHWKRSSRTDPDHPSFSVRTSHDGEYWFTVQTITVDGKYSPKLDDTVEPNMKVIVDTFPPSLLLEPDARRGSMASVRWDVKDENLDLKSLILEYQVEGAASWRKVPVKKARLIGSQSWDAGTAEALKVRASVADRAGNVTEAAIDLPEGTASQAELPADYPPAATPPLFDKISNAPSSEIIAGADFPPVDEGPVASTRTKPAAGAARPRNRSGSAVARESRNRAPTRASNSGNGGSRPSAGGDLEMAPVDLFAMNNGAQSDGARIRSPQIGGGAVDPGQAAGAPSGSGGGGGSTLLVANPRFKLQYAVDDAGPNGPATVELWITQDGGRTWIRRSDDPDRASPIDVDLGGEGTYGVSLVARSASGLGDQPPAPGDPPQSWVEVDSTPPFVQLYPPQVGTGTNSGKVAIAWRASDLHLAPRSVSLFWRPDQPGAEWQLLVEGQENVGSYIWSLPPTIPPRFHLRVEAVDTVGHRGGAETTNIGPVMVDLSRPRSRIIGLDSNARAGIGPSARPLR
ncbi:MAG: hypothetical protein ACLQIB_51940 [Isosphaeraceae bacterium]